MANLTDLPVQAPIAVVADRFHPMAGKIPKLVISREYLLALTATQQAVDRAPVRRAHVNRPNETASISTTALPLLTVVPGLWRVCLAARIRTAAGGTSSLIVTLAWTCRAVAQIEPTTALTANTTTTRTDPSEATLILRVDAATPISYSTTYASTGSPVMAYDLDIVAEQLAADTV